MEPLTLSFLKNQDKFSYLNSQFMYHYFKEILINFTPLN